jgi:hypothetical protein
MEPQQEHSPEQQARRHLLKLASYVPPAILGAMILGQRIALADDGEDGKSGKGSTKDCGGGHIVVSAGGAACCPCVPSSPQYNPTVCNQKKCQLGNCSACRQLVFSNYGQCKKDTANCGSCTCTEIGHGHEKFWMCQ